jgi:hypothetical protein
MDKTSFYKERHSIIKNCCFIYRIHSNKKGWWYVYITLEQEGRIRRSLKTTSRREAEAKAKRLYYKMRSLEEEGLPVLATSWSDLRKRYRAAVDYADTTERRLMMLDIFFEEIKDIKAITTEFIGRYEVKRLTYWETPEGKRRAKKKHHRQYPNPSETTIRMEMTTLHGILKWAFLRGLIPYVPEIGWFRRQKRKSNRALNYKRRGEITNKMHEIIWRHLDKNYKKLQKRRENPTYHNLYQLEYRMRHGYSGGKPDKTKAVKGPIDRDWLKDQYLKVDVLNNRRMWLYIHALHKGGMIRCSEWMRLKWKDVRSYYHDGLGKDVLEIYIPEAVSKVRVARYCYIIDHDTIFGGEDKQGTLARMLGIWKEMTPFAEQNDLIFSCVDGRGERGSITHMSRYFSKLLKKLDIKEDENGLPITSYSYRHKWISDAIRADVPEAKIAKAAGTSTTQIYRAYSHLYEKEVIDDLVEAGRRLHDKKVEKTRRANKRKQRQIDANIIDFTAARK